MNANTSVQTLWNSNDCFGSEEAKVFSGIFLWMKNRELPAGRDGWQGVLVLRDVDSCGKIMLEK